MFKNKHESSKIPELNLVPMMDVLMTVLTFFLLLTMSFTSQSLANLELPSLQNQKEQANGKLPANIKKLVIGLNSKQEIIIDKKPVSEAELAPKLQAFLQENPEGLVVVHADKTLNYQDIDRLLLKIQEMGGDRVTQIALAIKS
jgi:biopolymer transport protein ExbD